MADLVDFPDAVPQSVLEDSLATARECFPAPTCGHAGCAFHSRDVVAHLMPVLVQVINCRATVILADELPATKPADSVDDEEPGADGSSSEDDIVRTKEARASAKLRNIAPHITSDISCTFTTIIESLILRSQWPTAEIDRWKDVSKMNDFPWYQRLTEAQRLAHRTLLRYVMWSEIPKNPELSNLIYAGCCRHQRGETQFVSAFKEAVSAVIKDIEIFSTDQLNVTEVWTLTVDLLYELYQRGSIKQCLGARLCSRQAQHANRNDETEPLGVPWPIHPRNARFRDLTPQERAGLSQAEIDAAPTKAHGHGPRP